MVEETLPWWTFSTTLLGVPLRSVIIIFIGIVTVLQQLRFMQDLPFLLGDYQSFSPPRNTIDGPNPDETHWPNGQEEGKVSLVISIYAAAPTAKSLNWPFIWAEQVAEANGELDPEREGPRLGDNIHWAEVEAALMANLYNPYIDQVVLILDSATEEANCTHFLPRLTGVVPDFETISNRAELTCINRQQRQPTYFEMFNYSFHPLVKGDVVVMSNPDQAFDDTLSWVKKIQPNAVLGISTQGYDRKATPQRLRDHYKALLPDDFDDRPSFCFDWSTLEIGHAVNHSYSWDTFVFRPKTFLRDPALLLKPEDFRRRQSSNKLASYSMNENGAEQAALHDLLMRFRNTNADITSIVKPDASMSSLSQRQHRRLSERADNGIFYAWNPCEFIHTWHFHILPKSHKKRKVNKDSWIHWDTDLNETVAKDAVPTPYAAPPLCHDPDQCSGAFK